MAHDIDAAWSRMAAITNMTARVLRSASAHASNTSDGRGRSPYSLLLGCSELRCIVPGCRSRSRLLRSWWQHGMSGRERVDTTYLQGLCDVRAALYFCVEASVAACCHLSEL